MYDLVVFDLDGVLVDTVSSWLWVHEYFNTNNDKMLEKYMREEIDDEQFMASDIDIWLKNMPGMKIEDLEAILEAIPIMRGAKKTLDMINDKGIETAIVSAGIDIVAKRVADTLGIEHFVANGITVGEDGCIVQKGILRVELRDKATPFIQLRNKLGYSKEKCAVVGNSLIDVPMFHNSAMGIAFNADDDIVTYEADVVINEKNLSAIIPYIFD